MLLQMHQASKIYEHEGLPVTALHPTNLQIRPGEFVCLSGPSGSGKTTLLNLMGLLASPTSGEIVLGGNSADRLSRAAAARLRLRHLGLVFQEHNLIPVLSALENVEYTLLLQGVPAAERRERAAGALSLVGLADQSSRRPGEMSGGQQQRVAVARAIVTSPSLVLADEPTASLDSGTGQAVIDLLHRLNVEQGITFVFSSHDPRIIGRASRIIALEDGRIASDTGAPPS